MTIKILFFLPNPQLLLSFLNLIQAHVNIGKKEKRKREMLFEECTPQKDAIRIIWNKNDNGHLLSFLFFFHNFWQSKSYSSSCFPNPSEHQQWGLYMPNVRNIWHLSPKTAQQWEGHIAYAKFFLRFSYNTISNVKWYGIIDKIAFWDGKIRWDMRSGCWCLLIY